MMKINIQHVIPYTDSNIKERTENRLNEIIELGLEEVGYGQYGIKNIMSGLYVEMVWSFSDEDWKGYIDWIKELKKENLNANN